MDRRDLLKLLGGSALLLPLGGLAAAVGADPLALAASSFRAARRRHPVLAGWDNVQPPGTTRVSASVRGKWPKDLSGSLYRNGPGLWERGGQRYQHWFDGDGLLQHWRVADGQVSHQSRFVQTPKFVEEQAAGAWVRAAAGTSIPQAKAVSGPDDLNTANISVMRVGGKLFALWEAGSAFEIDPDSLATLQAKAWSPELDGVPFSAHPVFEADGSLWNFGQFGDRLVIYRIGADGALLRSQLVQLPRGGYLHSFAMTASKLVFVLAPLLLGEFKGSFFESLQWHADQPSIAVVVDKADLSRPARIHELQAGMAYHYADAWDEADGGVSLRACWYTDGSTASSPFAGFMRGQMQKPGGLTSEWVSLRLPAKSGADGRLEHSTISGVEFPISRTPAVRSDLLMVQGGTDHRYGLNSAVVRLDANSEHLDRFEFSSGRGCEEQLWVRAAGGKLYSIGTVFDYRHERTGLLLFDARRISDGPIAEAWLERAMPLGFHGAWVAA